MPSSSSVDARRELADDLALVDDEDAVGEREDLLELERDEQDARPSSRSSTSRRWTNSIAPTSRPRVGCAAISTRGSRSISRASTTFCWLPPESARARRLRAAAAHVELRRGAARRARPVGRGEEPAGRESAACGSRGARCSRRARTRARARAGAGPPGCGRCRSSSMLRARCACVTSLPVDDDRARRSSWRRPVIASISSVCPLPSTPAMPTISPARTSKRDAAHRLEAAVVEHVQVLDLEQRLAGRAPAACRRAAAPRGRPSSARGSASVAPSRGIVSTFLPRRSTVMRSAISSTSFSLWRDEDDRHALGD